MRKNLNVGDDDWIGTLSKLSPILSGVSAFGGLINSVISARQTAAFQAQLISTLQGIETTLEAIKSDLDAIYQELKNIEQDIEGLGLNDKLTAIEAWGSEMAALEPMDTQGAKNLATAMMDAAGGATNLIGCMTGLHNAMVGESIGTPLIKLIDPPSFLRLRARLVQGMHLLAFGTAFNTAELYDYSVFVMQWSVNFQQQLEIYLGTGKDTVGGFLPALCGSDGVVMLKTARSILPNVSLIFEGTGETMVLHTDDLNYLSYGSQDIMAFPQGGDCYIDFLNNQFGAHYADTWGPPDETRWAYMDTLHLRGTVDTVVGARGSLVCGARYNPTQLFLGSVNGQMPWLEVTGDRSSYMSSIHDGADTTAGLLGYDVKDGTVGTTAYSELQSLSPTLWLTSWVLPGFISIASHSSTDSNPIYLTIDAGGKWAIAPQMTSLAVKATAVPAKKPTLNPFEMTPSPVTLTGPTGGTRTALFHQL